MIRIFRHVLDEFDEYDKLDKLDKTLLWLCVEATLVGAAILSVNLRGVQ